MPTPLTDADKVLRNDTGKDIVTALNSIAAGLNTPPAEDVQYNNTDSGLSATNVQDAIDEVQQNITETDTALALKADKSTTYTKTEVDTALAGKADKSTTYTKTEVDTALSNKADKSTTYTKTEVDNALSSKANSSDVYTKTQTDTALANKANITGEYDNFTSGQANALKPSARLENSTPYLFRPSFSNGYGYETLIGGTCGVNQLTDFSDGSASYGGVTISVSNNKISGSGTATSFETGFANNFPFISGHKYFISLPQTLTNMAIELYPEMFTVGTSFLMTSKILECNNTGLTNIYLRSNGGDINIDGYLMIIDLTAYFNPTIADYVYTLETNTSGAGITWLKNNGFFNKTYHPYNAGGLLSVKTSKKINRGFNQLNKANFVKGRVDNGVVGYADGTTSMTITDTGVTFTINTTYRGVASGLIKVLPNTNYYFHYVTSDDVTAYIDYYDANGNWIRGGFSPNNIIFTTLNTDYFIRVSYQLFDIGTATISDICINYSNSSLNGTYEPYVSHEYPLDGNRKVHRVFGIVDMGSLSWFYWEDYMCFVATLSDKKYGTTNLIGDSYTTLQNGSYESLSNNEIVGNDGNSAVYVKNLNYTDAATFKTAMSGKYLVYELATPFDETVNNPELRGVLKLDSNNNLYYYGDTCSDFTNPISIDANGSEEFVDGNVYGRVDLGSLEWQADTTTRPADSATIHAFYSGVVADVKKVPNNQTVPNMYCEGYEPDTIDSVDYGGHNAVKDKIIGGADGLGRLWVYNSDYNDMSPAEFKQAISGTYLTYEKASSSGVEMPVGHETIYVDNSDKTKLENLPDISDSGDGTYVIEQKTGDLSLVPYSATAIIDDTTASTNKTYSSSKIVSIMVPIQDNAGYHNSIYRGKYLGTSVTSDQWAAISAGTFEDLFIGDYWTIGSVNWRIAHFNYWLNCGDTNTTAPHVVVVPDTNLYSYVMNDTNITTGGYFNSKMRGGLYSTETFTGDGTTTEFTVANTPSLTTSVKVGGATTSAYTVSGAVYTFTTAPTADAAIEITYIYVGYLTQGGLASAKTTIDSAFGSSHILSHRVLLTTATNSSGGSNWAWQTSSIDLMSEVMVYGTKVWANSGYEVGVEKEQLALFRLDHSRITNRAGWWLRSALSAAAFAVVTGGGYAVNYDASLSIGVRPAFAIF